MKILGRCSTFFGAAALCGCALVFGHPMTEDEFVEASDRCKLDGATLFVGSYMKASPSIIKAPRGTKPSDWDGKLTCVARLFGGDGVSKPTVNNFEFRFSS